MKIEIGRIRFDRSLLSGSLSCEINLEIPELSKLFSPYPPIFREVIKVPYNENTIEEYISILEKIKSVLDIWIKFLRRKNGQY